MRREPTAVGLVPVARAFKLGTGATPSALADYLTDALAFGKIFQKANVFRHKKGTGSAYEQP